ncbi:restriction endonuclease subunit S [Nostoc sp.]|uniref:restriction endonuclease subunit S n=1 Tax=Nostoc sp. TaxID=1180 RepID=UPI002FFB1D3A
MSKLPENWTITTLSEVVTWGSGGTPSRRNPAYFGGGISWIKTGELGKTLIESTEETISELGLIHSSAKIFPKGSVAIAMYGATIGKVSVLGIDAATNQACAVGIPDRNLTTSKFLYHYLCSQKDAFIEAGKGAAQPNISQAVIKNWLIPLPPLTEQKRIADKLDALLKQVDACRVRLNRIPLILKRFRQALLAAAISGQLTKDWRVVTESESNMQFASLSEALSELKTGPFGSVLHQSDYITGGIPIVNPMHINSGKITPSDKMTVSPEKAEELLDFILKPGDVVIARRGVMGRCAVVQPEQEGWICGTGSMILRSQSHLSPKYLQIFLSCPDTVEILKAEAVGTTMINLNQQVLLSLELWLPTLAEQQEIVHRVEHFFAYADRLEARHQSACTLVELLTPTLLAKAFRGELVPQDPKDESASVLLERIRAEREAQLAQPKTQAPRKPTMTKMTKESVKEVICQLPKEKFSFDELRENLTGDYDSLKDILFTLLSEAEPILTQVFDQEERAMRFFRAGK